MLLLESDDVTFVNGSCVCNRSGKSVSLAQMAAASYRALKLPPGEEPGLQVDPLLGAAQFYVSVSARTSQ